MYNPHLDVWQGVPKLVEEKCYIHCSCVTACVGVHSFNFLTKFRVKKSNRFSEKIDVTERQVDNEYILIRYGFPEDLKKEGIVM